MMVLERNIVLNVKQAGAVDTGIEVTQGDYGTMIFDIRVKDDDHYIADAKRARMIFTLSDGTIIEGEAAIQSGTYAYTFLGNELSVAGKVKAVISLEFSGGRVSSCGFLFHVRYNPVFDKKVPAGIYISKLEQIIKEAQGQIDYLNQLVKMLQDGITGTPLTRSDLFNHFLITQPGLGALDAAAGKVLHDKITSLNSDLVVLSNAYKYKHISLGTLTISSNAALAVALSDYIDTGYSIVGITPTITGSGTALCVAKHTSMSSVTYINFSSNEVSANCGVGLLLKK